MSLVILLTSWLNLFNKSSRTFHQWHGSKFSGCFILISMTGFNYFAKPRVEQNLVLFLSIVENTSPWQHYCGESLLQTGYVWEMWQFWPRCGQGFPDRGGVEWGILREVFFYWVAVIWGGVLLTIWTYSKAKNNFL